MVGDSLDSTQVNEVRITCSAGTWDIAGPFNPGPSFCLSPPPRPISLSLLPWSSFPGGESGDCWANADAIGHAVARPFAGAEQPPVEVSISSSGNASPTDFTQASYVR